jgi:uncharacterized protein (DUF58 family)
MLTSRAWWFLVVDFSLLALGLFDQRRTLALIGFTLLFWFLAEWLTFSMRAVFAAPSLRLRREIGDERGKVDALWAGHIFAVRLHIRLTSELGLPYVQLIDAAPLGVEVTRGTIERSGPLYGEQAVTLQYSIRCGGAGRVRFEGLAVRLCDLQGFFFHETFIASPVSYRVLPPLADAKGHRPSVKRDNLLPSPGVHRHLWPGSGSELLDLRDYLPGDPPKTIAWKVSARRDRLITKEFESEVPLRCTFFVDSGHGVRLGPPGRNALARLVEIAATAAQAAAGARDLTGLCVFDDDRLTITMRPARGPRHLVDFLNRLADAADLAPATSTTRPVTLLPIAYGLAQRVYPNLLRQELNRVPFWLPFLWQFPASDRDRPLPSRVFRWIYIVCGFAPLVSSALFVFLFSDFFAPLAEVFLPLPEWSLLAVLCALTASGGILYYAALNFFFPLMPLLLSIRRRNLARWRKRLAALLALQHDLGPGGCARLLEDDEQMSLHLQRFLALHHVPFPIPLYGGDGRYLFAAPRKIDVLASALVRSVGKGRDNELFVLLVDLLEQSDRLDPLLRAVKVAVARHHLVMVVCAWPPGVPAPPSSRAQDVAFAQPVERSLLDLVHDANVTRLHRAFHNLRQSFTRLGVPVVCADVGDPVRLILDRLDHLRYMGTGRRR